MKHDEITEIILECAFEVHSQLGPGLMESCYEIPLVYELRLRGLKVEQQKELPLIYKGKKLGKTYRIDILVENKIIIEVKAVEYLMDIHTAQLLTYMKLTNCQVGLILNFNVPSMRKGIKRVVRNYNPE